MVVLVIIKENRKESREYWEINSGYLEGKFLGIREGRYLVGSWV